MKIRTLYEIRTKKGACWCAFDTEKRAREEKKAAEKLLRTLVDIVEVTVCEKIIQ